MASASGTSILGTQTLINNSTAPGKIFSVSFPGQVSPPVKRLGYFWLYQFDSIGLRPHFVVEKGTICAPGIFYPIRIGALSGTWLFRLDVNWTLPGVLWSANIV
jgi:hypothetical protein